MSLIVASAAVMKTKHNLLFNKFSLGVILSLCSWDFTMQKCDVFAFCALGCLVFTRIFPAFPGFPRFYCPSEYKPPDVSPKRNPLFIPGVSCILDRKAKS
jgi:hypothetical protein